MALAVIDVGPLFRVFEEGMRWLVIIYYTIVLCCVWMTTLCVDDNNECFACVFG